MIRLQSCPICHKPLEPNAAATSNVFPFCSDRCRCVDLFRWLDGRYAIVEPLAGSETDDDGESDVTEE